MQLARVRRQQIRRQRVDQLEPCRVRVAHGGEPFQIRLESGIQGRAIAADAGFEQTRETKGSRDKSALSRVKSTKAVEWQTATALIAVRSTRNRKNVTGAEKARMHRSFGYAQDRRGSHFAPDYCAFQPRSCGVKRAYFSISSLTNLLRSAGVVRRSTL
jgi:hypothetical protein